MDANYDPHIPGSGSDNFYLASLIMQAFLNGITLYRNALNDELIEIGDEYSNITLTVHDYDSDGKNEDVYTFGGAAPYSDTQTGIELSEQVLIEKQDENGDVWHLSIDSDVTDFGGSPPTDNGGLRIDFPDESSVELFVDVEIDEVNMTIGPNNFETAVWELDGVDILGYILPIFF